MCIFSSGIIRCYFSISMITNLIILILLTIPCIFSFLLDYKKYRDLSSLGFFPLYFFALAILTFTRSILYFQILIIPMGFIIKTSRPCGNFFVSQTTPNFPFVHISLICCTVFNNVLLQLHVFLFPPSHIT